MYIVSPDGVTLLSNRELCKEESQAASNLNKVRSSTCDCDAGVLPAPDAGTPFPTIRIELTSKTTYFKLAYVFRNI